MDSFDDKILQTALENVDITEGIDNEGLDFSQLEEYIHDITENRGIADNTIFHSDGIFYPWDDLKEFDNVGSTNIIQYHLYPSPCLVDKTSLPESPPDSSSEPPFSPDSVNGFLKRKANLNMNHINTENNETQTSVHSLLYPTKEIFVSERSGAKHIKIIESKNKIGQSKENKFITDQNCLNRKEKMEHCYETEDNVTIYNNPSDIMDRRICFTPFQKNKWHLVYDDNLTVCIQADKGFHYSSIDEAFVCQKKNHFQITVQIEIDRELKFVSINNQTYPIEELTLQVFGVHAESVLQHVRIEQSYSDRSKHPLLPIQLSLFPNHPTKLTLCRLHFAETTLNNMRKKGRPNPDQRYFQLVTGIFAMSGSQNVPVVLMVTQCIIVRASNPGQFENDIEVSWQRNSTSDGIYHIGNVGINTERPDEALVIQGNMKISGNILHPSDNRIKDHITELDTQEQLRNVQALRVVHYEYKPNAVELGISSGMSSTGVIAQEVQRVLPDAVTDAGDLILPNGETVEHFLVVNKERIFLENVGAVKELCKVTSNLEARIGELERINHRLINLRSKTAFLRTKPSKRCWQNSLLALILALLLTMTLCLATMAALYILDRQQRVQPLVYSNLLPIVSQQLANNSILESDYTYQIPMLKFSQDHNLLKNTAKKLKNHQYNMVSNLHHTSNNPSPPIYLPIPNIAEPPYGLPLSCLPSHLGIYKNCPVYCCSMENSDKVADEYASNEVEGDFIRKSDINPGLSVFQDSSWKELKTKGIIDVFDDSNTISEENIIIVRNWNATFSCNSHINCTLNLLLSKHMLPEPLQLQFKENHIEQMMLCSPGKQSIKCSAANHFNVDKPYINKNILTINPGLWLSTSYRLRIPIGVSEDTLCHLPDNQIGFRFREYNLNFQRYCS